MKRTWGFERGREGFFYEDDTFRFTDAADHARGSVEKRGGYDGAALAVTLGGVDASEVRGMSGGWTAGFKLEAAEVVTLTFRYKVSQSADQKASAVADVRIALDGEGVSHRGEPYVLRVEGDGPGGRPLGGGWRKATIELGPLDAGRHEITLGGYINKKHGKDGATKFLFDDVSVEGVARDKPVKLGRIEAEVLKHTNAFRKEHGLDPVSAEKNLTKAAEDWSRDMAKGDFFRHSSLPDQFEQFGYNARGYAENIAAGYPSARAVVDGWINSPGHRANLLRADMEHIGIGHYEQKDDGGRAPYGQYWTQIFGDPSSDYFG